MGDPLVFSYILLLPSFPSITHTQKKNFSPSLFDFEAFSFHQKIQPAAYEAAQQRVRVSLNMIHYHAKMSSLLYDYTYTYTVRTSYIDRYTMCRIYPTWRERERRDWKIKKRREGVIRNPPGGWAGLGCARESIQPFRYSFRPPFFSPPCPTGRGLP